MFLILVNICCKSFLSSENMPFFFLFNRHFVARFIIDQYYPQTSYSCTVSVSTVPAPVMPYTACICDQLSKLAACVYPKTFN